MIMSNRRIATAIRRWGVWCGGEGRGWRESCIYIIKYIHNKWYPMVMCPFYSMLPVKNTFMYLAIKYQPVEDGSYKASYIYRSKVHRYRSRSGSDS